MAQSLTKIFKYVLLGALVLMSLAAGVAKTTRMPHEVEFFEYAGVPLGLLIPFGILQVIAAILAVVPKTRKLGLILMGIVFLGSAIMILAEGNISFGGQSLLPVAIAAVLAFSKWGAEIRPLK